MAEEPEWMREERGEEPLFEEEPRAEWARRYVRRDVAERLKRSIRAAVASLRRWERYYAKRFEETRLRLFHERLKTVRRRLETLLRLRDALRRVDYDVFKLAVADTWLAMVRGDNKIYVPDELPETARKLYRDAVAAALEHHTRFGRLRTGWDGLVDCDGYVIDALRDARPSDRVSFYAYVKLGDYVNYRHGRRVKVTDTLTVHLLDARISDVDTGTLFELAHARARELAETLFADVEEVCVVARPAFA